MNWMRGPLSGEGGGREGGGKAARLVRYEMVLAGLLPQDGSSGRAKLRRRERAAFRLRFGTPSLPPRKDIVAGVLLLHSLTPSPFLRRRIKASPDSVGRSVGWEGGMAPLW